MGLIVLSFVMGGAVVALMSPWVGIIDGYACILLGPQVLWWWAFNGLRYFFVIALCTGLGSLGSYFKGQIDFRWLKTRQNLYLFIWWFFIILSYCFGPYIDGGPGPRYFQPTYILGVACNSFLFYYLSTLCITDEKKFKCMCIVIITASVYYIYWINNRYLSGHYGRLGGPKAINADQYGDQNNLAMFFVISLPFLYYLGFAFKNKVYRYITWLIIPFGWHAIFLTGSRGGLLGLGVTSFVSAFRNPNKFWGYMLISTLIIAFIWQGGPVMKDRAATLETMENGQVDESAQGRLDSWAAASKMILAHPVTGVGIASFGVAFPDFSRNHPREAHNTYFQIAAESGVVAVIGYLSFILSTIKLLWQKQPSCIRDADHTDQHYDFVELMHNAILVAWVGFAVCACFLSLQVFEQFFYLAILSNFLLNRKRCQPKSLGHGAIP